MLNERGRVDSQGDAERRAAGRVARNIIAGPVSGQVVQAGSIDHVHFHESRRQQVVPSQLPMMPARFIERDAELATLRRMRADHEDRAQLVVLTGPGGMGKTTLALQWLREMGGEFPDGQLYLELHTASRPEPVTPFEALGWFLEALDVPAKRIPADLAQRAALFRSVTATRRLTMCLDNAVSAAQVRALLPGGDQNMVVVTSRSRLTGLAIDGARFLDVPPLEPADALTLIGKILGADRVATEPDAARAVVDLCGGVPLAVALVVAPLASRTRQSLGRKVDELRTERNRLSAMGVAGDTSVEAVLDPAYLSVGEDARRVYRVCGDHPGRVFGADVAAVMVGWDVPRMIRAATVLVEANLLIEVADDRFAYHDLLLVHARARAELEDGAKARTERVRRAADWYLAMTVAADMVLHPLRPRVGRLYRQEHPAGTVFADEQAALRWLTKEYPNLVSVVDSASRREWDEITWQMCEALWGLFLHARRYGDWIAMHAAGITSARRCGDRRAEARLRSQLGFAHAKLRRFDAAVAENTRALRIAEDVGDDQARATALSQLGRAARGRGDLRGALGFYRQARDVQQQLGETRGVALCRRRIGEVLTQLGDGSAAVTELRAAVDLMAQLGDRTQHARSLQFLGVAHRNAGDPDLAVAALRRALTAMRELGSPYYQAEILAQLGETAEQGGDLDTAASAYREASDLFAATEDPQADVLRSRVAALAAASSGS